MFDAGYLACSRDVGRKSKLCVAANMGDVPRGSKDDNGGKKVHGRVDGTRQQRHGVCDRFISLHSYLSKSAQRGHGLDRRTTKILAANKATSARRRIECPVEGTKSGHRELRRTDHEVGVDDNVDPPGGDPMSVHC